MADLINYEDAWHDRHRSNKQAVRNNAAHINAAPKATHDPIAPPDWMGRGECGGANAEKFARAYEFASERVLREAKDVCATCPVRELCLQFELEQEGTSPAGWRFGVFGGATPQERYDMAMEAIA